MTEADIIFCPYNYLIEKKWVLKTLQKLGMVDPPKLSSPSLEKRLRNSATRVIDTKTVQHLKANGDENGIILLQDAITSLYDAELVHSLISLLEGLGLNVYLAPFFENGKALHVKGYLTEFTRLAKRNASFLRDLSVSGLPIVAFDPAIALTYREEYRKALSEDEAAYTITASIPGLDADDFDITLDENVLTIKGEHKSETESDETTYHLRERRIGRSAYRGLWRRRPVRPDPCLEPSGPDRRGGQGARRLDAAGVDAGGPRSLRL